MTLITQKRFVLFLYIAICLVFSDCYCQDMKVAVLLQTAFEMDGYSDMTLFKKSEKIYLIEVKKDTSSFKANNNLGSLYLNYSIYLRNILISKKNDFTKFKYWRINSKRKKIGRKGLFYMERAVRIQKRKKVK